MMERQVDFLDAKTRELDILAGEIVASAKELLAGYFYREFVPDNSLS